MIVLPIGVCKGIVVHKFFLYLLRTRVWSSEVQKALVSFDHTHTYANDWLFTIIQTLKHFLVKALDTEYKLLIHFTDEHMAVLVVTYSLTESSITLFWPFTQYGVCKYTVSWDSGSRTEVIQSIEPYIVINTEEIPLEKVIYITIEIECLCHLYGRIVSGRCTRKATSELL